jgi:double-GTPase-like protein
LAIIGPTSSGKTSLIASLYQSFQKPPTTDFTFARSRTLPALEQAVHDARGASRRAEPQSETTPHSPLPFGVSFYHLGLRHDVSGGILDLLIADRNGGEYMDATDDPTLSVEFVEVKRADCLTILVDGERLLDLGARHNCRSEIEMILEGLKDSDVTSAGQNLVIVLTKLDKIRDASQDVAQKAENDFDVFVEKVRCFYGHFFNEFHSLKVAASPKTSVLPYGFGVLDLLNIWAAPMAIVPVPNVPLQKTTRAMAQFLVIE